MAEKSIIEMFGEKSRDADMLDSSSLQEIGHTQRGEGMDLLYKALTMGGEDRFIHKYQGSTGDTDTRTQLREWRGNMLRNEIEQNPSFADTLSQKEGMERLGQQEGILTTIMKKLLGR